MASGSSSSSMSPVQPTSPVPAQHSHLLVNPMKQISDQPESSCPKEVVVIAPSPIALLNDKRYVCEVCLKGFLRKQNLTLHRRAHNLPFCLKTKKPKDLVGRKVYLCPEPTCQHHNLFRPLGDFGGLRKHYLRKHCTQKKYKCDTCSKMYAAETDLRAHIKVCGKRRHICHCGARFARGYNFVSHQKCCVKQEHEAAVRYPPTLQIGDRSGNNSFLIGSSSSYAPNISTTQNLSKSHPSAAVHQYPMCPSGRNKGCLMTDPSIGQMYPDFFSPSSTKTNKHKLQTDFDTRFYADLLMDKIPLDTANHTGGGSSSNSSGGGNLYQSRSHNLIRGVGSSTFNQESGGCYNQGGNYSYGDYSGQSAYGYGMEEPSFETSAATAGVVTPYGQILNQFRGFWF